MITGSFPNRPSLWCQRFSTRCQRSRRLPTTWITGHKGIVEKLWREFFSDPSQWWDHRAEKGNVRYPDFKHKMTQRALWLDSKFKPPWVEAMLAAITPGTLQSNSFSWNTRIAKYVKGRQYVAAMELFQQMKQEGLNPDRFTFVAVLNACAHLQALEEGKCIHAQIIDSGCDLDVYVNNSLVDFYAKCGRIEDSWEVFSANTSKDVVGWNAIIQGYVKCGEPQKALELSQQMQQEGVEPDPVTFVGMLNACASLGAREVGIQIHTHILERGYESDIYVCNSLVDMYSKCGSIDKAQKLFNSMPIHDVVGWNSLIQGYVKCGLRQKALELFQQMQEEPVMPDAGTFVVVLNACASLGALQEGIAVHRQIIQHGHETQLFVGCSLVDMYAKCGSVEDAWKIFNKMPTCNVVTWNSMIVGYVKCGQAHRALELFQHMQQEGIEPDRVTIVGVLKACAILGEFKKGRDAHAKVIERRWESDLSLGCSLVDMYAKCGSIEHAWDVFNKMPSRDVVAWNLIILGYVKCGQGHKALELSRRMQQEKIEPDTVTFVGILNACASVAALAEGSRVHEEIIKRGFHFDVFVGSSLIDMYAKCGSIDDASRVFQQIPMRNVVCWNALILGHVKCGQGQKALDLSQEMQLQGVEPNLITFVGLLNACASVGSLDEGRIVHTQVIQSGCECKTIVGNSLIDMYAKCGSIDDALRVFKAMPMRNVVSWNALIVGYVRSGQGQKALELYQTMQQEGVEPNCYTFVGLINACASVVALEEGRRVHAQLTQSGFESDALVCNSLIDMYGKCGNIEYAEKVFNGMPTHLVSSWNSMLGVYAIHGHGNKALGHFSQMAKEGVEVDQVTFVSLLSACSHGGLVDEGLHIFECMNAVYGISAAIEHYACMVNLLGRTGRLHEAENLIETLCCRPNVTVRMSLLGSCRVHGNVEMGEHIAKEVLDLDPGNAAGNVLLSNIYAAAGKWDRRAGIRKVQKQDVKKQLGHTQTEVNNEVYCKGHPEYLKSSTSQQIF